MNVFLIKSVDKPFVQNQTLSGFFRSNTSDEMFLAWVAVAVAG